MSVKVWDGTKWVSEIPNGGTAGQVLSKASATDGDVAWADSAGGGGAVDWANASNITVHSAALMEIPFRNYVAGGAYPQLELKNNGGGMYDFKTGTGGSATATVFSFSGGGLSTGKDVTFNSSTRKGIKFWGAALGDTYLNSGTTAGSLLINGAAIQTAVLQADGTEYGLADALAEIRALKAELAELRGLIDGPWQG